MIRPTNPKGIAMGVVNFLTERVSLAHFLKLLKQLARQADMARRGF
jgi:hypothetical protein